MIEDVTERYYDMLNSFRADNFLKVTESQENENELEESYFEHEKKLFQNKNERLMNDVELLEELEFELRHEKLRIIKIKRGDNYPKEE